MAGLDGIFGDGEKRKRRKRARKSGGGNVSGKCGPGSKDCKIPFFNKTNTRGKIPLVKIERQQEDSDSGIESHSEPRFMSGRGAPPPPKKQGALKKIFSKSRRSKAVYH